MIWTLLRQDPALRTLRVTLPASIAVALFTRVLLIDVPAAYATVNTGLRVVLLLGWINLWGLLMLIFFKSHFWARCSRMSLALPLRPTVLWLTRMGAMIISVWTPLALTAVWLAVRLPADGNPAELDRIWLERGAQIGVGAVLALVLWQLPCPGRYRSGSGRGYFLYALLVVVAVFPLVRFVPPGSIYTILALGVALAGGIYTYANLPKSFAIVPHTPEGRATGKEPVERAATPPVVVPSAPAAHLRRRTQPRSASVGIRPVSNPRSPRMLTITTALRLAHHHWSSYLLLGVICLYGFLLAHGYTAGRNLGPYAVFILIWIWYVTNQAFPRLRNIDGLPLSRRFLFAVALLPTLAACTVGWGLWQLRTIAAPPGDSLVNVTKGTVAVPPEFWEISHESRVPVVESPSGETHRPRTYRVISGTDLVVYNPYDAGGDNSAQFVAFQLERAVEAVHEPSSAVRTTGGRGSTHQGAGEAIEDAEAVVERWRGVPSETRRRTALVGAVLIIVLGAAIFVTSTQAYRSPTLRHIYMGIVIGVLMVFVASMVAMFIVDVWEIVPPEVLDTVPNILVRKAAESIPVPTTMLWIVAALTVVGCYFTIEKRFERAELFAWGSKQLTEEY